MTIQEFDFDPLGDNRPRRLGGNFTTKKYPLKIGTPNPDRHMTTIQKTNQIVITMPTDMVREFLINKRDKRPDYKHLFLYWYIDALINAIDKGHSFNYWLEHQRGFILMEQSIFGKEVMEAYEMYGKVSEDWKLHEITTIQKIILAEGCLKKTIKVYNRNAQKWLKEIQYYEDRWSDGGLCGYGAIYFIHPYGEITHITTYMS